MNRQTTELLPSGDTLLADGGAHGQREAAPLDKGYRQPHSGVAVRVRSAASGGAGVAFAPYSTTSADCRVRNVQLLAAAHSRGDSTTRPCRLSLRQPRRRPAPPVLPPSTGRHTPTRPNPRRTVIAVQRHCAARPGARRTGVPLASSLRGQLGLPRTLRTFLGHPSCRPDMVDGVGRGRGGRSRSRMCGAGAGNAGSGAVFEEGPLVAVQLSLIHISEPTRPY